MTSLSQFPNWTVQKINFHCLDQLLSIQIELAFSFNILSDTPDCFHTEMLHMYAESWFPGGFMQLVAGNLRLSPKISQNDWQLGAEEVGT